MIVYVDASSLVKRYVSEQDSAAVVDLTSQPGAVVGTALLSRAEVSAAIGKAVRLHMLEPEDGRLAVASFRQEWPDLVRIRVSEPVVARADHLAWEQALRGYDAVHLAAALVWREAMDEPVAFATHDKALWRAARERGLDVWPPGLGDA